MMEVVVAKHVGFCFGVDRAVEMADKAIKDYPKSNIFTYGKLVHNPQVLKSLEDRGVHAVEGLDSLVNGDVLIIESHGAAPKLYEEAREKAVRLVDATCPHVKNAHKKISLLQNEGYFPIIVGEENHPEVMATRGYAPNSVVVSNVDELVTKLNSKYQKIGVVSQTTHSVKKFKEIVSALSDYAKEIRVFPTICSETSDRQSAAAQLADQVDLMVVIGGYKSANTRNLFDICRGIVGSHHIESPDELKAEWFQGKEKIGVTAGASTPTNVVNELIRQIEKY